MAVRMCLKCCENKSVSKFDKILDSDDGYDYLCKKCKKGVIRNVSLGRVSRRKLKQKCVEYKGGKCSVCGYNKCIAALDFHHINPVKKKRYKNNYSLYKQKWDDKAKKELDVCILVCANCHREIHFLDENPFA